MKSFSQLNEKVDSKKIKKATKAIQEILDVLDDLIRDGDFMARQTAEKDISKIIPQLLDINDKIKKIK